MRALVSLRVGAFVLIGVAGATASCSGLLGISDVPTPEDGGAPDVGAPDSPPHDSNMPPVDANHPFDAGQDVATPVDAPPDVPVDSPPDVPPKPTACGDAGRPPAILLPNYGSGVLAYDPTTGASLGQFNTGAGQLVNAYCVTVGPDCDVYVGEFNNKNVQKFNGQTGAFVGVFATVTDAPNYLAFGPDGNLYVAGFASIYKFDGTTGAAMGTFATGPANNDIGGFVFHNGLLIVTFINGTTGAMYKYDGTTGANLGVLYSTFPGNGNGPRGPVFGPDGNLYVPVWQTNNVLRFNGSTLAFMDTFVNDTGSEPLSIFFRPSDGNMLLQQDPLGGNDSIRIYGANGTFVSTLATLTGRVGGMAYLP